MTDSQSQRDSLTSDSGRRRSPLRRLLIIAGLPLILAGVACWSFFSGQLFRGAVVPGDRPVAEQAQDTDEQPLAATGQLPLRSAPDWEQIDDPQQDGWDTEVFHEAARHQLGLVGKWILSPTSMNTDQLREVVAEDFEQFGIHLPTVETVYQDQQLQVLRNVTGAARVAHTADPDIATTRSTAVAGRSEFERLVQGLSRRFEGAQQARIHFKIVGVEREGAKVRTRQYVAASGLVSDGMLEQHAVWSAWWVWNADAAESAPLLQRLELDDFEEIRADLPSDVLFRDATAAVLSGNPSYSEQMLRGLNHWLERMQDVQYFPLLGAAGLAAGDVNGDGLDDLFVCQETGLPNKLFLRNPDGTASDVSAAAAVDWLEATRSALLLDLDNDGDQDLVASLIGSLLFLSNDGAGHFTLRETVATGDDTMSLAAADYDLDGDVDVYICVNYANDRTAHGTGEGLAAAGADFVYHDANNGGGNSLFRNDGDFRFLDVTRDVGLDVNNRRYSLAAAWEDFDNDGDQDLYVANDYGRNNLFRNDRTEQGLPFFVDVAGLAGAEDSASGMSVSWGDYDQDGWMDCYVGNMFSSAGNRITFQSQFKPGSSGEVRTRLQRFARGNTLLRNQGTGVFDDVSSDAAVTMGRWAWSSSFVDVNNDSRDDLIVANGYITTEDTGDL